MSSTPSSVAPAASARSVARWITGPSASGSENGTPISRTSAPARSRRLRISAGDVEVGIAGRHIRDEAGALLAPRMARSASSIRDIAAPSFRMLLDGL